MLKSTADMLLKQVYQTYDTISEDFSRTRQGIWKDFYLFEKYIKHGMSILDLGCGNGRLIALLQNYEIRYTGLDSCKKLLEAARQKYPAYTFVSANMLNLPFADQSFDMVIAIASLHHIPSLYYRRRVLSEIKRVLKKGARLIASVWNIRHLPQYKAPFYISIARSFLTMGRYDIGDTFIPWKDAYGKHISIRYYHAFSLRSLGNLAESQGFHIVELFGGSNAVQCRQSKASNLFIIAEKV